MPATLANTFQVLADACQHFRSLPDQLVEISEQLSQLGKVTFCEAPDTLESRTLTRCDNLEQGCLDQLLTTLRTHAAREAAGKCADYFERNRTQCWKPPKYQNSVAHHRTADPCRDQLQEFKTTAYTLGRSLS